MNFWFHLYITHNIPSTNLPLKFAVYSCGDIRFHQIWFLVKSSPANMVICKEFCWCRAFFFSLCFFLHPTSNHFCFTSWMLYWTESPFSYWSHACTNRANKIFFFKMTFIAASETFLFPSLSFVHQWTGRLRMHLSPLHLPVRCFLGGDHASIRNPSRLHGTMGALCKSMCECLTADQVSLINPLTLQETQHEA